MDLFEKLKILTDAAKYDVACTSSGVDRKAQKGQIGSAAACGICHSFAGDGRFFLGEGEQKNSPRLPKKFPNKA